MARFTAPIVRVRLDVVLHAPPAAPPGGHQRAQALPPRPRSPLLTSQERPVGTRGRKRCRGAPLAAPATEWEAVTLPWYGGGSLPVELASGTAGWYGPGKPPLDVRQVVVRDPRGRRQWNDAAAARSTPVRLRVALLVAQARTTIASTVL